MQKSNKILFATLGIISIISWCNTAIARCFKSDDCPYPEIQFCYNSSCRPIPNGGYKTGGSYKMCAKGSYGVVDKSQCVPCPAGYTTKSNGTVSQKYCVPCSSNSLFFQYEQPVWERQENTVKNLCKPKTSECADTDHEPGTDVIGTETVNTCFPSDDFAKINDAYQIYSTKRNGTKKTICPKGQYVYSCAGYRVGYNWIKSNSFPYTYYPALYYSDTTDIDLSGQEMEYTTNNYDTGNTLPEKSVLLRNFLGNGNVAVVPETRENATNPERDKDIILGIMCNPNTNTIVCSACPNNGTTSIATTVDVDEDTNMLIRGSWKFNTIADCFATEFEDYSGTFVYTTGNISSTGTSGAQCYYRETENDASIAGDEINGLAPTQKLYPTTTSSSSSSSSSSSETTTGSASSAYSGDVLPIGQSNGLL